MQKVASRREVLKPSRYAQITVRIAFSLDLCPLQQPARSLEAQQGEQAGPAFPHPTQHYQICFVVDFYYDCIFTTRYICLGTTMQSSFSTSLTSALAFSMLNKQVISEKGGKIHQSIVSFKS